MNDAAETPLPAIDVKKARHGNHVVEVGVIARAAYRLDIPDRWNGELLLFCHGYRSTSTTFDRNASDSVAETYASVGFAVAQSGYSATGYALEEAAHDTEMLRRYVVTQIGSPERTWLSGESLGGSVAMMLLETRPDSYDGGLSLCAPLGPAISYIKALVFDALVLFEYTGRCRLPPRGATMGVKRVRNGRDHSPGNPGSSSGIREHSQPVRGFRDPCRDGS